MPSDRLVESVKRAIEDGDLSRLEELFEIAIREKNSEAADLIDKCNFIESNRWKVRNELLEEARRCIKYNDKEAVYSILQVAKLKGHVDVIRLIEESGLSDLYRASEEYLRQVEAAIGYIESLTTYRYKELDRQGVHHHHAKSITFYCPEHGAFAISSTSALKALQTKDSAELEICPICKGFKRASDRLQINIKLSLDHSRKISELLSFYHDQNLSFLGAQSDPKTTSNATSLARFMLETAIEEIYYEMLNNRQINELAEWIQFDECKEVQSALNSLGSNPYQHAVSYTPEYEQFLVLADAKLFHTYLKRARSEWEEMASSIHFEELFKALWYEAINIALRKRHSKPSFIERDIEIVKRLNKIRSLDGGIR
jgi:hypothetical protein